MNFQSLLPSLEFCNFELGLHALQTDDTFNCIDNLPPSVCFNDNSNSLPPSQSVHVESDDHEMVSNTNYSESAITDDIKSQKLDGHANDPESDSATFSDSGLPKNMKGIWKYNKRRAKRKERLVHRNKTNSPNIYHKTNKRYRDNYIPDNCPWNIIPSPTVTSSLVFILFVSAYNVPCCV